MGIARSGFQNHQVSAQAIGAEDQAVLPEVSNGAHEDGTRLKFNGMPVHSSILVSFEFVRRKSKYSDDLLEYFVETADTVKIRRKDLEIQSNVGVVEGAGQDR